MPFGPAFFGYVLATALTTFGLSFCFALIGHQPSVAFWAELLGAM